MSSSLSPRPVEDRERELQRAQVHGYHLKHNFGHDQQNLVMMFAALNLLAFAIHTVCDGLEALWIEARARKRERMRFFEHIGMITAYIFSKAGRP